MGCKESKFEKQNTNSWWTLVYKYKGQKYTRGITSYQSNKTTQSFTCTMIATISKIFNRKTIVLE